MRAEPGWRDLICSYLPLSAFPSSLRLTVLHSLSSCLSRSHMSWRWLLVPALLCNPGSGSSTRPSFNVQHLSCDSHIPPINQTDKILPLTGRAGRDGHICGEGCRSSAHNACNFYLPPTSGESTSSSPDFLVLPPSEGNNAPSATTGWWRSMSICFASSWTLYKQNPTVYRLGSDFLPSCTASSWNVSFMLCWVPYYGNATIFLFVLDSSLFPVWGYWE